MRTVTRVKAAFRKTYPDLKALLLGHYPGFVYGLSAAASSKSLPVPVFCYHSVDPVRFEQDLSYLKENGYATLNCSEWLSIVKRQRTGSTNMVLLTFDDGDISLFRTAFPLLKKYDFQAVGFICPGLIPDRRSDAYDEGGRKLCNWSEIRQMHATGFVDFQCHGFNHDLVFTSDEMLGFLNPQFESHFFGKGDHAVVKDDGLDISLTNLRSYEAQSAQQHWGVPVYRHKPRMAAEQRFVSSSELRERLKGFVESSGGLDFFQNRDWEKALRHEASRAGPNGHGRLVRGQNYQLQIAAELDQAKQTIDEKLPGKAVRHLCPPWFVATEDALETSASVGFLAAFLGVEPCAPQPAAGIESVLRVQRLSFRYIHRLPGNNRRSLLSTFLDRWG
jgi:hypothetical protein